MLADCWTSAHALVPFRRRIPASPVDGNGSHESAVTKLDDIAVPPCNPVRALVRRAIELIWNRGDPDAADELCGPGYVNHYGLSADLVLGPEAIKVQKPFHVLQPTLLTVGVGRSSEWQP